MTALFRDNYIETLKLLSKEQLEQIKETNKDYICLNIQVCNAGAWIDLTLTDDWSEIEEDFNNGECTVLGKDEIFDILESEQTW